MSLAVDAFGRIWVLDRLSCEVRVFDRDGAHVRTIGRCGSGPGEFRQPVHLDMAPNGHVWVVDPPTARISVVDTAGIYLRSIRMSSAQFVLPWTGGFDTAGYFYSPVVHVRPPGFRTSLVRRDTLYAPLDTFHIPVDPIQRDEFRIIVGGVVRAAEPVPFQGTQVWRLARSGSLWGLITDEYKLFEVRHGRDTVRTITKTFRPVPVTTEERRSALQDLHGFVDRGGVVEAKRIPAYKPPVRSFFIADTDELWVERTPEKGNEGLTFDAFDSTGLYVGTVSVPFRLSLYPAPVVRAGVLVGVALDSMDVEYIVRARLTEAR